MRKRKTYKTNTTNKPIPKVEVRKMRVEQWIRASKYMDYSDILLALFGSQELVSEDQLDKALKTHLEREV